MATPEPIRDSFLERPLPSSPETEKAILGAVILDNTLIAQAIELLKATDFYVPSHRRIFTAMIALFERGSEINPILIAEELRRDNSLDSSGGVLFLTNLTYGLPHVTSIAQYGKVVRGKSLLRQLVKVANKITAEALEEEDEPQNILDHAEHAIFALADERIRQGFEHIKHPAERVLEKAEAVEHRDLVVTGVPTGFRGLDALTSGLQKQDFVVIAARPAMGKTSLALTLAQHAAIENNAVVGIFSLEMSAESLAMRILCSEASVDAQKFRSGYLSNEEWSRLGKALGKLADARIFIDDTAAITVLEMRAKARRLATEQKQLDSYSLAADMMRRLYAGRDWPMTLVTLLLVWSCFGSAFAGMLGYARIPYGAAKEGHFYAAFARVHPRLRIPHVSLLLIGALTLFWSFFDLSSVITFSFR